MARTTRVPTDVERAPLRVIGEPAPGSLGGRQPTHDEIAQQAYAIFLANGSQHGHDQDDWLQAEQLLRSGTILNLEAEELESLR
jgi:hypothetical protein